MLQKGYGILKETIDSSILYTVYRMHTGLAERQENAIDESLCFFI